MKTKKLKALWVQANPSDQSFNQHLFETGTKALSEDYEVMTSDLYAMDFDARLSSRDLGALADQLTPRSSFMELTGKAYAEGQIPEEIRQEQAKILAADLLVLQFPLWWYGVPAILKGWFDRVLTEGFADGDADENGSLAGRKALVVVTAGDTAASMGPRGANGDIETLMFPITHGTLWYTGIASFPVHLITETDGLGTEGAEHEVNRLVERLKGLSSEEPVAFRKRHEDYPGDVLNPEILPGRTDIDIHLSK